MASKTYSPVRIVNPASEGQIVYLCPNQDFVVKTSKPCEEVIVESKFFYLEKSYQEGKTTVYRFTQKYDLSAWTKPNDPNYTANTFLGEVWFAGTEKNEYWYASLCVILGGAKAHSLSIISPQKCEPYLRPDQLIEIIVYQPPGNTPSLSIENGASGLMYQKCGQEIIVADNDEFTQEFTGSKDKEFLEYHYWFRYNEDNLARIISWPTGNYFGGKIIIDDTIIRINIKKKNENWKNKIYPFVSSPAADLYIPSKSLVNNYYDLQPSESAVNNPYRPPISCKVTIEEKETSSLEDGCKTVDFEDYKEMVTTKKQHQYSVLN